MKDLVLRNDPTLADYQEYVRKLEQQRGFSNQTVLEECLLDINLEQVFREKEEINKKGSWK